MSETRPFDGQGGPSGPMGSALRAFKRLRKQDQRVLMIVGALVVVLLVALVVVKATQGPACGDYCVDPGGQAYQAGEADGRQFAQQNGIQAAPDGTTTDCLTAGDPMEPNKFGYTSAHDFANFNSGFIKGCSDVARAAIGLPPVVINGQ
jgi:hypothetical protein